MPIYNIRGINVDFPYDAYDSQVDYMDKVIQALQEKNNALLESPTGTGKTLCLLCATLAYRASLGPFSTGQRAKENGSSDVSSSQSAGSMLPKIVYTSRTHSQLRQVVQELKKTNYRPKMIVLGSREQLCIHDKVKLLQGKAQTNACSYVRKRRSKHYCKHHKLTTDFVKSNPQIGDEPIDIEDLVNIGRSCGPCPYYVSRELIKCVDILFAPYNYLIDRAYKDSLGIEWNSSILIFDEAHNLESICADAASFDLPSTLLSACISEAKNCIDISIRRRDVEKSSDNNSNPDNFAILRALLLKLEKRIAEVPIESKELGFTRPGPYMYELLADLNVTSKTANMLTGIIEEAVLLLEEDANGMESKDSHGTTCRLQTMSDILKTIFRDGNTSHAKYYRVHVQERLTSDSNAFRGNMPSGRTLSWWCFNPGISMEDFSRRGVGSVILTSGTLSPLDSFAYELKLDFPIRLENPHVISSSQIWAGAVPVGPSGFSFNSSYRNRDVLEYKQELGNAIVNFARIVPDGLLVFFPSYYVMEQCISCWKDNSRGNVASQSTIWERICKFKQPVIEPRQSSLFGSSIEDFTSKLNDPSTSGAVFFAVCRGKVSEGLDFADQFGRAVIVTGLPFATRTDPKIRLKREFLDEHARDQNTGHKPLTGEEWYDQQASRAVNQAVGRVIRHRHDYGAIIFCDERFASSHRQSQVSRWIQPHIKCYSKFGDVVYTLTRFFRAGVDRPVKIEPVESLCNGKAYGEKFSQSRDSCCSEMKFNTVAVDKDCCIMSSSSRNSAGKGGSDSQLCEILPANRSSLAHQKQMQAVSMKQSSFLLGNGSKLRLSGTTYRHKTSEIVDLTSNDSSNLNSDAELIVSCSSKRQRVPEIKPANTQYKAVPCDMTSGITKVKSEGTPLKSGYIEENRFQSSLNKKMKKTIASFSVEAVGNITAQESGSSQANQGTLSLSCQDEEAKGYNFLTQIQAVYPREVPFFI
ncbi:regulator of telomere elongation helicase 1 homolog isoform X3 [Beta vulgaris subsp. vulgaris]|uniref:regulator of telomere elongation helicase 1 homolog isoform X3 n=1 Tax=Beta vulgaris subsp. vulgaris TaxID=3555 RepID=UPI002037488F|nr:regulator of telomere elongation helicase 1 homolog isoform X3 [Beta vulgaris subsp. vulgaris]